jgi:hypothetical protein
MAAKSRLGARWLSARAGNSNLASAFQFPPHRGPGDMQFLFTVITDVILEGLGALVKKLVGKPRSESGVSEMWIGVSVVVVAAVIAFAMV